MGDPGVVDQDVQPPELAHYRVHDRRDGQMNFTGYNAPPNLTPPPAGDTIDGSKLGM